MSSGSQLHLRLGCCVHPLLLYVKHSPHTVPNTQGASITMKGYTNINMQLRLFMVYIHSHESSVCGILARKAQNPEHAVKGCAHPWCSHTCDFLFWMITALIRGVCECADCFLTLLPGWEQLHLYRSYLIMQDK